MLSHCGEAHASTLKSYCKKHTTLLARQLKVAIACAVATYVKHGEGLDPHTPLTSPGMPAHIFKLPTSPLCTTSLTMRLATAGTAQDLNMAITISRHPLAPASSLACAQVLLRSAAASLPHLPQHLLRLFSLALHQQVARRLRHQRQQHQQDDCTRGRRSMHQLLLLHASQCCCVPC